MKRSAKVKWKQHPKGEQRENCLLEGVYFYLYLPFFACFVRRPGPYWLYSFFAGGQRYD